MRHFLLPAFLMISAAASARDFADPFERDGDGNGLPDGWTVIADAAGAGGRMALGAGRDGQGLALWAPAGATLSVETRLSGRLDLANDYVLAGAARVQGPAGSEAWLTVQFVDEKGDTLGAPFSTPRAGPGEWTALALPVSLIDSRTRSLAIRAVLAAGGGGEATAAFDDVSWVAKTFVDGFEADLDKDNFPDRWRSMKGDEFPAFNATGTKRVTEPCRTGSHAVQMSTAGRSVGLETRWAVSIDPDRAYMLTAWVKTEGLEDAAAWAEVEWLDEADAPLGTERTAGLRGDADWRPLALAAGQVPPHARKARLKLVVVGNDVAGRAWFDDVEWLGRVKVTLDTQGRSGNVYRESEAREAGGVTGNIVALGLETGSYEVFATALDADGAAAWEGRVGGVELNVRENLAVPFKFTTMKPGPYTVEIRIRAPGQPTVVGEATFGIAHDFIFPRGRAGDYGAFFNPWTHPARHAGPLFGLAALGRAHVVLWDPAALDHPDLTAAGPSMHELLLDLRRNGVEVIGVLASPPGAASGRTLAEWFGGRDRSWEDPLGALVAAHRDVAGLWQLGDADLSLARPPDAALLEALQARIRAAHEYSTLGLSLPPSAAPPPADSVSFFTLDLDATLAGGLNPALAADPRDRFFSLAPTSHADLARKIAAARARGWIGVSVGGDGSALLTPSGAPTASWFTLRLLNDLLSGAHHVPGELLPDVLTFKKDDRLILFVNPSTPRLLDAWLGDRLVRLDLLGRASAVPTDAGGRQRIETGTHPFFLVVSDTAFAETQLSGTFEGNPLKSRTSAQTATLRLVNRFPEPIHNLRIVEAVLPPKWHPIDPALELTSVAPGAEARFPLEISLPSDVRPGDYAVRLKVSFSDGTARREATLTRVLTVRPEVDVLPRIEETADGKGLEVTVTVRNRGEKKTDFKIYVNRGNGARTLDEVVYGLEPGAERIVRFLAPKDESGREYVIGLRGIEDDLFVNEVVRVP